MRWDSARIAQQPVQCRITSLANFTQESGRLEFPLLKDHVLRMCAREQCTVISSENAPSRESTPPPPKKTFVDARNLGFAPGCSVFLYFYSPPFEFAPGCCFFDLFFFSTHGAFVALFRAPQVVRPCELKTFTQAALSLLLLVVVAIVLALFVVLAAAAVVLLSSFLFVLLSHQRTSSTTKTARRPIGHRANFLLSLNQPARFLPIHVARSH